jgi:hypothetical protein
MTAPKTFSEDNASGERYELDRNNRDHVIVYRFGDQHKDRDWLSRRRQKHGDFGPLPASELNDWALKQSSYGSQSEDIENNPFLSMATDYESLFKNGEGWVQKILEGVPDLGIFSAPFADIYRPSPTKLISKQETEWLYYDGRSPLLHKLVKWVDNPFRK